MVTNFVVIPSMNQVNQSLVEDGGKFYFVEDFSRNPFNESGQSIRKWKLNMKKNSGSCSRRNPFNESGQSITVVKQHNIADT